jgi:hypothetical protein
MQEPLVIAYDNKPDNENTRFFIQTLKNTNWKYKMIGEGEEWKGFINRMMRYLEELYLLEDDTIVVLSDARDVIALRDPKFFIEAFKSFQKPILVYPHTALLPSNSDYV